jgi:alpha-glucosidase (family GH31 glycosyl hydrolase)
MAYERLNNDQSQKKNTTTNESKEEGLTHVEIKPNISKDKKKLNKAKIACLLLFLGIIVATVVFLLGCFLNFYMLYKYETVFDGVEISSHYDKQNINLLLPMIDVKFLKKNLKLEHRVVPINEVVTTANKTKNLNNTKYILPHNRIKPNETTDNNEDNNGMFMLKILDQTFSGLHSFFKSFKHKLNFKLVKEDYLRIYQSSWFEFHISKLKTKASKWHIRDHEAQCYNVNVTNRLSRKRRTTGETETCIDLANNYWYGGHESYDQPFWPINNQTFDYVPYVTGFPDGWAGVVERYWISSNGVAIFFDENVPLYVNHSDPGRLCFKAANMLPPYSFTKAYSDNLFEYKLCTGPDIKSLHMYMIENFLGKPSSMPDLIMMKSPIFTTWNYFFKDINQSVVINFAQEIVNNNYSRSQLEIDDKWEEKYGDLDFDKQKFPDPKNMTNLLRSMGFRVTLWVHPFCNIDSKNFLIGTDKDYWVNDKYGLTPSLTSW